MAHEVVRSAAEHALLFRERVQLSTLGIIPVGGMHMRQGAFTQTLAVSQGVFGKAGMEKERTRTFTHTGSLLSSHTHTHTLLLQCFSGLHVEILSRCIINVPFSLRLV